MGGLVEQILPFAIGISISPVPIIAAVLMLMSPKAKTASSGFLLGWLTGILVVTGLFSLLSNFLPEKSSEQGWVVSIIQLLLGIFLFLLATKQFKARPSTAEDAALPVWMQAVDKFGFGKAFGLSFVLASVNPKNLLLAASAGMSIGSAGKNTVETMLVVLCFSLLAAATVAVPVIAHRIAPKKLAPILNSLRLWLTSHNTAIMATLLIVFSAKLIGSGVGGFI